MHTKRIRWGRIAALAAAVVLSAGGVEVASGLSAPALASASDTAVHTQNGPVINMLGDGDSYMAGNGADGATYLVSPDDLHTPPAPYQGSGCWRKYNTASMQAFNLLGSTGFYINRACSGRLTSDVIPEVGDLINTPTGNKVDLILYSAGGNDVFFSNIAIHCVFAAWKDATVTVNGLPVSTNCVDLLNNLQANEDAVVTKEHDGLVELLASFPNAKIVMDGYPMLVDHALSLSAFKAALVGASLIDPLIPSSTLQGMYDTFRNSVEYTRTRLATAIPEVTDKQKTMVAGLGSRVAFNDLFTLFGGVAGNHGVFSADPWLHGFLPSTHAMESLHPNGTGHSKIAAGIVATVNAAGWFGSYPIVTGRAAQTFNYIPGDPSKLSAYVLTNSSGTVYKTTTLASQLASCRQQTLTIKGWVGTPRHVLELTSSGPDTIYVRCETPRTGDIVKYGSQSYLATATTTSYTLRSIPTSWMYNCLAGVSGVRKYATQLDPIVMGGANVVPGRSSCVPSGWRNHVLVGPNGAAYFVDGGGVRHWVQSTQTFYYLTQTYGAEIRPAAQVDVDTIPEGSWQPEQLYAPSHYNTIIRRSDGVSWIVDGAGYRHHIPTYVSDVCSRWIWGFGVSETGLSYALANSLPESNEWSCSPNGYIFAANEGAAYYMDGDYRRWIQDPESFSAYAQYHAVVRGISQAELNGIPEAGWMPLQLYAPYHYNTIIRRNDGVSWIVDGGGWRHHIPNYASDVCSRWVWGYGVSATGLNYDQGASLPESNEWNCDNYVVATNEGASYLVIGGVRHWIQDAHSFWAYANGRAVVRGISMAEVRPIPEGGWAARI